jgi:hypothetical protein
MIISIVPLCSQKIKMENVPLSITAAFIITTFITIYLLYKATINSKPVVLILFLWMVIQAILSNKGFYIQNTTFPPRFILLIMPPVISIIVLFSTAKGQNLIDQLNIKWLILLHVVRIAVEAILFSLYLLKQLPIQLTFEGQNFDILSGITAPFIFYYGYIKGNISNKLILLWNFICLALLLNVVVRAILSVPGSFQKFSFNQPNKAILYFPFSWLPSVIVPIVLFSHLVSIRAISRQLRLVKRETLNVKIDFK